MATLPHKLIVVIVPKPQNDDDEFVAQEEKQDFIRGVTPKYVIACECGAWHLETWKKASPDQKTKMAFKCRSWRHEGACRLWKGAQDFTRCKEAIEKWDFWLHLVLTFARPKGLTSRQMYLEGKERWSVLRKRIVRAFGKIKYIQTWERHRTGHPHVHIALSNCELFESAVATPRENWENILQSNAVECGFGSIGWLERLNSKVRMAAYLAKLARELTGRGKDYQVPVNAPKNFRRLRASVRLLPPVHKDPDLTGLLKMIPL